MAAETDARCRGSGKKLAAMFEKLAASSPSDARKGSDIINGGSSGSVTCTGYSPVISMELNECVPCDHCFKSHPAYSCCPYLPCHICGKDHRSAARCPYFNNLPKGATFHSGYEIVCCCGNMFNEEKWACCFCGRSRPVLKGKYCDICGAWYQHRPFECTEDKKRATDFKSYRDEMLSRVPIPHLPVSPESSPATTPSSLVSGDMKQGKDSDAECLSGETYSPFSYLQVRYRELYQT